MNMMLIFKILDLELNKFYILIYTIVDSSNKILFHSKKIYIMNLNLEKTEWIRYFKKLKFNYNKANKRSNKLVLRKTKLKIL